MNGELVLAVSQQNSKLERTNSADERITHHIWDVFEEQTDALLNVDHVSPRA